MQIEPTPSHNFFFKILEDAGSISLQNFFYLLHVVKKKKNRIVPGNDNLINFFKTEVLG